MPRSVRRANREAFCLLESEVRHAERWQSGRLYLTRNQAYGFPVPRVRIPLSPPSSFKLVPSPSNSFQTVRGHLRARRAVSSDRLPLIPSLQNLHFASLKARLCRLGTGSEPFRTVWNRLEMAVPKHPKRALDLQRRPNQAGLFVSLDVFDSVQDLAHDLQVGRPFANRTPALQA